MLVGQIFQFKGQGACFVETLVEKSVKTSTDGTLQFQDKIIIQGLDVAAGETAVDGVIPDEKGTGKLKAPLPRLRLGPAAFVFLRVNLDTLQDVEFFIYPLVGLPVAPSILIVEGDANPSVESLVYPVVALAVDGPPEEFDKLVAAEENPAVLELLDFAKLDEPQKDLIISRGGKSVRVGTSDSKLARYPVVLRLIEDSVFEMERLDRGVDTLSDGSEGKLRKVKLVAAFGEFLR